MRGKFIVLGTTIGNIDDVSLRAIKTLFKESYFFAEDTRVLIKFISIIKERYSKLFEPLELDINHKQEIHSYRDQNHDYSKNQIIEILEKGNNVVLTSDSGMPLISDPGFLIVKELVELGFEVDVVPGPTALTTAIAISGLKSDKFVFLGFMPRKPGKIASTLEPYINESNSIILYESPYRVVKLLEIIKDKFGGDINVAAISELTKKFQKNIHGDINSVIQKLRVSKSLKGEWVIILEVV